MIPLQTFAPARNRGHVDIRPSTLFARN